MSKITEIINFNPQRPLKKGLTSSFIEMAALETNSRNISTIKKREFKGGGSKFKNGDVLFARITPCLENGKTAKVSGLNEGEIAFGSTEFIVMSAKEPDFDEHFIYYLARLPEFRSYAQGRMEGTSGRQRVSWQSLSEFEINFPVKETRKKIGETLNRLDKKIALNTKTNETLEKLAQALFKSWFVDFDPVKAKAKLKQEGGNLDSIAKELGMSKEILELFPDEFEESELGLIPKGWEVKPLDEIAHYQNGLALQKFRPEDDEASLPVLKIAQLKKGFADGKERARATIKPECIVNNGDIVFSWSGSLMVDVWCGDKVALNQHLFKVTSKDYPKWFYYNWTKHHLKEFQQIAADKAVTMGHIKREHLSQAKCIIPNKNIGKLLNNLLEKQIQQRIENITLEKTRDTLLPKLLSGEIQINNKEYG